MPPKKHKAADCDLCCKRIVEGKDEALHCDGGCGLWFHRYCAGVSASHFKDLSNSPEPFVCYFCYQRSQLAVTKHLRDEVTRLNSEINKLSERLAKLSSSPEVRFAAPVSQLPTINKSNDASAPTHAATLKQASNHTTSNPSHAQSFNRESSDTKHSSRFVSSADKKFNIVVYGLCECPKGSPRHERMSYDTDLASKTIQSICPRLSEYAIRDCSRIGKYSEERARPLIIKFARSCDAATVLANRHKISKSDHPNVFLKPFMTVAERKTESTLLRERRALIESGIERKLIKIRGNSIFVKKCKVGSANEDTFFRDQHHSITDVQKQSREPTPICDMNATINATPTNVTNTMSTAAADNASTFTCGTTSVLSARATDNGTFTRSTINVSSVDNTNVAMSTSTSDTNMSANDISLVSNEDSTSQTQTQERPLLRPALTNNPE